MPEDKTPNIIIDSSSIIALYKLKLIDILKDLYASLLKILDEEKFRISHKLKDEILIEA